MAKYTLEDSEQELLEEIFNMAQKIVDLQVDDETAQELQYILEDGATLFGIRQTEIVVTDDGEGKVTIDLLPVKDPDAHTWTPKIIEGDKPPSLEEDPR